MKKFLILLLAISTFACSSIKISYDFDRKADISQFKTYKLSKGTHTMKIQQLDRDRVIAAVEKEMAVKGFTKSDNPDLIVDVNISGKEVQSATSTTSGGYGGYGRYRGWSYGGGFSTTQINYDIDIEGTMVISFVDASVKKIVWQGTGTKTLLEHASTKKKEKNISFAVQKILEKYPPSE